MEKILRRRYKGRSREEELWMERYRVGGMKEEAWRRRYRDVEDGIWGRKYEG